MDAKHFDTLTRALTETGTRRELLGLLASLPLLGGVFALFAAAEVGANGRRKRRKKRHKHGKGRDKGKRHCKPHAKTKTCSGKCGPVKNNCKKTVDCGACTCDASSCPLGQCCGLDGACDACLVFVTSEGSTGDLDGLDGADARCQAEAEAAGVPGLYRAWLGDDTDAPATRFTRATVPYVLRDGTVIATGWDDLTTAKPSGAYLAAPIAQTANGNQVAANTPLWTHVRTDGASRGAEGVSCLQWTSPDAARSGDIGSASLTTAGWTELPEAGSFCSNTAPRLYCFQQR